MKLQEIITRLNQASAQIHGTDKESCHGYITNFYESEFLLYKDKIINILEIGIYTGDSLLLWKNYFKNGNIYGIDVDENKISVKDNTINYIFGNAYDDKLVSTLPNFDIIIDDGPHSFETQHKFIELYYPKLNKGGLMVIEDLHHEIKLIDELIKLAENLGAKCEFIDTGKLYNSKLISIKKI